MRVREKEESDSLVVGFRWECSGVLASGFVVGEKQRFPKHIERHPAKRFLHDRIFLSDFSPYHQSLHATTTEQPATDQCDLQHLLARGQCDRCSSGKEGTIRCSSW
jgi:hypothetical protein